MVNYEQYSKIYCGYFVNREFIELLINHCVEKKIIDPSLKNLNEYAPYKHFCLEINEILEDKKIDLEFNVVHMHNPTKYKILIGMPFPRKKIYDSPSTVFIDYGGMENIWTDKNKNKCKAEIKSFGDEIGFCLPEANFKLINILNFP